MNFFEEVHLKEQALSNNEKRSSRLNFKIGLLIGAVCVIAIVFAVSFQTSSKDSNFEVLSLHLDSVQIHQNQRMIQLLEIHAQRDTTIVHIVAPAL